MAAVCAMTAAQSLSAVAALQQAGYRRMVAALGACAATCVVLPAPVPIAPRVALRLTVQDDTLIVAQAALDRGEGIAYRIAYYYGGMTMGQISRAPAIPWLSTRRVHDQWHGLPTNCKLDACRR
jgi:hypothetical protein